MKRLSLHPVPVIPSLLRKEGYLILLTVILRPRGLEWRLERTTALDVVVVVVVERDV
jgi:hypothetical protein